MCSVWLELWINLTSGLLQTKHLTNVDQWKEEYAVLRDAGCIRFPMTIVRSVKGL